MGSVSSTSSNPSIPSACRQCGRLEAPPARECWQLFEAWSSLARISNVVDVLSALHHISLAHNFTVVEPWLRMNRLSPARSDAIDALEAGMFGVPKSNLNGSGVPVTTYFKLSEPLRRCRRDGRPTLEILPTRIGEPMWCGNDLCIPHDWTGVGHLGSMLEQVFSFLATQKCGCAAAAHAPPLLTFKRSPQLLTWWLGLIGPSMGSAGSWALPHLSGKDPTVAVQGLSAELRTLVLRASTDILGCRPSQKYPSSMPDVSAVARISYDTQMLNSADPTTVTANQAECVHVLRRANALARQYAPKQQCAHVLATDWFAMADGPATPTVDASLRSCWHKAMGSYSEAFGDADGQQQLSNLSDSTRIVHPASPHWWWVDLR